MIGSGCRRKLPLDNAEAAAAEKMVKGMETKDAVELLSELIRQ